MGRLSCILAVAMLTVGAAACADLPPSGGDGPEVPSDPAPSTQPSDTPGTPVPGDPSEPSEGAQPSDPSEPPSDAPSATASPAPTPGVSPHASGLSWSSGLYAGHDAEAAADFGTWRNGRPVDNIVVFPARDSWSAMLNTWWYSSLPSTFDPERDDLVVSLPLWPDGASVDDTGTDAQWRQLADQIEARDPNAWVRLGWEMNIGQPWAITNGNKARWADAFDRAVNLMRDAAPQLRFVWNPNKGADQSCDTPTAQRCSRDVFEQVAASVDAYAIDSYDSFPALTSDAAEDAHLNGFGNLEESLAYATANGKLFAVPEWGVACDTSGCQWAGNAGGDNPRYVQVYLDFFAEHATDIAFESYFEEPAAYIRSALNTNPIGPNAPAAYRDRIQRHTQEE
jgi:hypothetical protein